MINVNGELLPEPTASIAIENRGYKYGDALFETLKVVNGKVFFWEDHYFRLMSSMRIMRMEIPMSFTMEYLEAEILKTVEANALLTSTARVRLSVDRGEGGKYQPAQNSKVGFNIKVEPHPNPFYTIDDNFTNEVDLYKDYYQAPGLLSGLKNNNKALNVMGSIYAKENQLDNCLILNTNKSVIEALNGNLFWIKGDTVKTPPLEDGCLKGVMRQQIVNILLRDVNLYFEETSISPFELQKADEMFITNVIQGLVPITKYRKKSYGNDFAKATLAKLNAQLRLT